MEVELVELEVLLVEEVLQEEAEVEMEVVVGAMGRALEEALEVLEGRKALEVKVAENRLELHGLPILQVSFACTQ